MKPVAFWASAAGLLFWASQAHAHLVTTGMGPLYDGITHFALSPEEVLPVVAIGLLAGLRSPAHARRTVAALAGGWVAGAVAAGAGVGLPAAVPPVASAVLLVAAGGALAANAPVSPWGCATAAAVFGAVAGLSDFSRAAPELSAVANLAGICAGVVAGFVLAASLTLPLRREWLVTAARVAGSWLLALGVLLAGWILRRGAVVP